jgi:RHS repeat-associated protein
VADDAIANLTKINSGTQPQPTCPKGTLSVGVDGNNLLTGTNLAYDAAGNMTQDGSGTGWLYTFDDEGHLTIATGPSDGPYCYVYDGFGLRVAKKSNSNSTRSIGTVMKLYWRSISGDALAETDGSVSTTNIAYNEYVFFGGRRIASRNGLGAVFYYFADQLGSVRTITTGSGPGQSPGQLCWDQDYTPYGQEVFTTSQMILQTTACPPSYKFTGYESDSETGLDYAFARYYSSRLGRFVSSDPIGGSVGNLQSNNAYAYVLNNPTDLVDPLGLDPKKKKKKNPPIGAACRNPLAGCTPSLACMAEPYFSCPGSDCSVGLDGAPASCNMAFALLFSGSAELPNVWWAETGYGTDEHGWVRGPSGFLGLALGGGGSGNSSRAANNCTPLTKGCYNVPTVQQFVQAQCMAGYNGSTAGQTVQFFSPLQMIPGWGQDPPRSVLEFTGGLAAKYGILSTAANAGQPAIQTLSTDGWSLVGPIESSVSWLGGKALSLGKAVMPWVYAGAGGLDLLAHAGCATVARQEAGQMTPTPVGGGAIP